MGELRRIIVSQRPPTSLPHQDSAHRAPGRIKAVVPRFQDPPGSHSWRSGRRGKDTACYIAATVAGTARPSAVFLHCHDARTARLPRDNLVGNGFSVDTFSTRPDPRTLEARRGVFRNRGHHTGHPAYGLPVLTLLEFAVPNDAKHSVWTVANR